jgi:hypothetical protein
MTIRNALYRHIITNIGNIGDPIPSRGELFPINNKISMILNRSDLLHDNYNSKYKQNT